MYDRVQSLPLIRIIEKYRVPVPRYFFGAVPVPRYFFGAVPVPRYFQEVPCPSLSIYKSMYFLTTQSSKGTCIQLYECRRSCQVLLIKK